MEFLSSWKLTVVATFVDSLKVSCYKFCHSIFLWHSLNVLHISGGTRTQNLKWVEQYFSSFLAIFFKVEGTIGASEFQKIIKYAKNVAKNEVTSCSTCRKHIFWLISRHPKTDFDFRVTIPPLLDLLPSSIYWKNWKGLS